MKRVFNQKILILLSLSFLFTACLTDQGQNGKEGNTNVGTIPYIDNVNQPSNLVCDALSSSPMVSSDPTAGLVANLFYLEPSQPRYSTVNDYINLGSPVKDASLYFNDVNIPTRPFDRGFFTNEGQVITTFQGNTLYEYFALEYLSDIVLSPQDAEGDYQFAILADDGSILALRGDNGQPLDVIVDDDGTHSTKMACATTPISLNRSSRLPINYRYYQGPRYHIASIILWRPWPTNPSQVVDSECGKSGNSRYFDSTQNPPAPQAAYNSLLSRGWKVLQAANYKVPRGIENSCNVPAPNISNDLVAQVTTNSAEITWSSDIPATSQVEVTNNATGTVSVTVIDTLLVYSHDITVPNLTANTLYTAVVISSSASGKSTRGSQLVFKTRR